MKRQTARAPIGVATLALAAFMLFFAPAASAVDYTSTGSATWSDPSPSPGQAFTISGVTTPNTIVVVTVETVGSGAQTRAAALARTTLGTTTSDGAGNYSLTVTLPTNAGTGTMVIEIAAGGSVIASSSFTIAATGGQTNAQTTTLPVTGSSSTMLFSVAAALLAGGGLVVMFAKRPGRATQ
jgi:LPXTG-motif cell wall-anchored protein